MLSSSVYNLFRSFRLNCSLIFWQVVIHTVYPIHSHQPLLPSSLKKRLGLAGHVLFKRWTISKWKPKISHSKLRCPFGLVLNLETKFSVSKLAGLDVQCSVKSHSCPNGYGWQDAEIQDLANYLTATRGLFDIAPWQTWARTSRAELQRGQGVEQANHYIWLVLTSSLAKRHSRNSG